MTSASVQPAVPHKTHPAQSMGPGIIILIALVLLGLFVMRLDEPSAKPGVASVGEFSLERALKDVEAIGKTPHPIGSAGHDQVEKYITESLSAAGLSPEIQRTTAANQKIGVAATVANILAVVKGSQPGKSVLLVAHYDSVATGPGASDDSSSVAALLDAARIARSLPQPKRDIQFLFTDGEELGLLGAAAFVKENPAARNVGVVLNFDARGTSGPVILFETSDRNNWLIQNFSQAVPRHVANSLSYEIYKRLPNDTDFTIFKNAGYEGLNFAFIDGVVHYHTATDNLQNLDRGSLQQLGDYAVKLSQWFGNLDQLDSREGRATYFDILGRPVIHYSFPAALAFLSLAVFLFAFALFLGFRRGYLSLKHLAFALAAVVAAVLAAALAGVVMQQITGFLQARFPRTHAAVLYHSGIFVAAFILVGAATAVALYLWAMERPGGRHNVAAAGLLVWMGLAILVSVSIPGAAYLFVWPLLFNAGAWIVVLYTGGNRSSSALTAVAMAATVILLAPIAGKIFTAFGLGAGPILATLCGLFVALCIYYLPAAAQRSWMMPAALYGVGGVLFVAALVSWNFDHNSPKFDSLIYGADADARSYVFASYDARPDEWTANFLGSGPELKQMPGFFPWSSRKFLQSPAQSPVPLSPPELRVLENKTVPGGREVHLRIKSAREAPVLSLFIDQPEQVLHAALNGKEMSPAHAGANSWSVQYYGSPAEGIDVLLTVRTAGAIHLQVEDISYGLPPETIASFGTRPGNYVPMPARFNDCTLVTKQFSL